MDRRDSVPSLSAKARFTFLLYLLGWLPGVIANLHYLSEARRYESKGAPVIGASALRILFWVFVGIPVSAGLLIFPAVLGIILDSHSGTSPLFMILIPVTLCFAVLWMIKRRRTRG